MLNNLQALRAFAALSVVVFHFTLVPALKLPAHYGSFGVDLFFVLSGFIIAYSASRNPHHFLVHRLIRVLPSYWIATTIGLLMILLALPVAQALGWWGQSLFFLPGPGDRPIIIFVGWTLVYELAFYVVYAAMLKGGRRWAPYLAAALLVALAYGLPHLEQQLRIWPLLLEFAYGLAIFVVTQRLLPRAAPPVLLSLAVAAAGLAGLYWFEPQIVAASGIESDAHRVVVLGLPAAAVVLGLVWLEQRGVRTRSRVVLALGDASYAMYLLHPLIFAPLLAMKPGPIQQRLELFAALTLVTILLAWLYYRFVEAPTIRVLRRRLAGDGPPVVLAKGQT